MNKWVINDDGDRDFIGNYDVWIEEPDADAPEEGGTIIAACFRENAPLLRAAPEMLAALKEMVEEFRQLDLPYGSAAYLSAINAIELAERTDA